jgi:hypothetical protein
MLFPVHFVVQYGSAERQGVGGGIHRSGLLSIDRNYLRVLSEFTGKSHIESK